MRIERRKIGADAPSGFKPALQAFATAWKARLSGRGASAPLCRRSARRGAALLTVLWLTAALTAIAFAVANTVRGEIERTSTSVDSLRSYYLATGAIDRTILYMLWGPDHVNPDGSPRYWVQGMPRVYHNFPTGDAIVEVIPVTAKLNVNIATEQELHSLLLALGADEGRAMDITGAILDWRQPAGSGLTRFDQQYLSGNPSFRSRHASFEEIEEVLLVQGMTPDLFYGSYARDANGRLVRLSGLKDCITVYGANAAYDVNTADPALLRSIGVDPGAVDEIIRMRQQGPILRNQIDRVRQFAGPAASKLIAGGNSIFTLRATARLRLPDGTLSDLRRSAAAEVKFFGAGFQPPYQILRWHDNAPSDTILWP